MGERERHNEVLEPPRELSGFGRGFATMQLLDQIRSHSKLALPVGYGEFLVPHCSLYSHERERIDMRRKGGRELEDALKSPPLI